MGLTLKDVALHVIDGLRKGSVGKLAAAQLLESAVPPEVKELGTNHGIKTYWHCRQCLNDRPAGVSPAEYAKISAGFTKEGMQIWCWRHGLNIANIHFEGQRHPCNQSAGKPDPENRSKAGETYASPGLEELILAVEFGVRSHEKGNNLQATLEAFRSASDGRQQ